jgi:hypothetical protein
VFLFATLTIAYDIFMFYSTRVGPDSVLSYMNLAFVPVGLALLLFIIFSLPREWGVYVSFTLICLGVAFSLQILTIPAKRFHFFQYAPLTVLVFDALRFTIRGRFLYIWTLALVALIGLGDETLQWMLPNRYFGIVDLVVNTAAGLFTLAFIGFVLGEENYPWGLQRSKDLTDHR